MGKEFEPIQNIEKRRERFDRVIKHIEARWNAKKVKEGSSLKEILRVGQVRRTYRQVQDRLKAKTEKLDQELNGYIEAKDHLSKVALMQSQLTQMSDMLAEGNLSLSETDLKRLHQEFQTLTSLPKINPPLQRGIERIKLEQEAKQQVEQKVIFQPSPEEKTKEKKFVLPSGEEIAGIKGKILYSAKDSSTEKPLTLDDLRRTIYPRLNKKTAERRLHVYISEARKALRGSGLELINLTPPGDRPKGIQAKYYIKGADNPVQIVESHVESPKGKEKPDMFELPNSKKVYGIVGKCLNVLASDPSKNYWTREMLRQEMYPDTKEELGNHRVDETISRTRRVTSGSGLEIINLTKPGEGPKGIKAKYHLKRTDNAEQKAKSKQADISEATKSVTDPEFGSLSKVDIVVIAAAFNIHKENLERLAKHRKIELIDESTIKRLSKLEDRRLMDHFRNIPEKEHDKIVHESRINALEKAGELISSPDINKILESIDKQNPDVWGLLFNLYELSQVPLNSGDNGAKEGIDFLKDLLTRPQPSKIVFKDIKIQ